MVGLDSDAQPTPAPLALAPPWRGVFSSNVVPLRGIWRLDILRRVGGRHAALYEPLQAMEQQTHTSPNSLDFGHRSYRVGLSRPLECGGKRSATPLLIVGGAETRPQSVSCGMEPKAPSSLRSAGALQNALTRPSKMSKLQTPPKEGTLNRCLCRDHQSRRKIQVETPGPGMPLRAIPGLSSSAPLG